MLLMDWGMEKIVENFGAILPEMNLIHISVPEAIICITFYSDA